MSVQSEIDRIITAVGNAYSKVSEKGGTVPASQTVANLATAIESIPSGGTLITKTITENGTYNASADNADGYSSVSVNVSGVGGSGYSFTFPATATNFPTETKLIFADGTEQAFSDFPSSLAGQTFHNVIMWGWAAQNYTYPVYDVSFTGKMINYSKYANSYILQNNFSKLDYFEPPLVFYICEDIVMTKFSERNDD